MICRSCGSPTEQLMNLGMQPLANALLCSPHDLLHRYPLTIDLCTACQLGQLRSVVSPELMFREYLYYSSVQSPVVESAKLLVDRIVGGMSGSTAQIVEIASNDGYLLQFYKDRGIEVLGIDPAVGPADAAIAKGIPTMKEFFTLSLAHDLPKADVVHANNVLAHVPDLNDFVAGLSVLLKDDGTCFIEVPYLGNLLADYIFDTFYHEHVYYFSLRSLEVLLVRHNLHITDVEPLSAQGGSLRLKIRKRSNPLFSLPPDRLRDCVAVQHRTERMGFNLLETLLALRSKGARIWGYGAAAKATVMMNYCRIDSSLIEGIADETPAKIGKYIPGTGVKVHHPDDWLAAKPDYTCIFAWNYAQVIAHRYVHDYRGNFFTPYMLPEKEEACSTSASAS